MVCRMFGFETEVDNTRRALLRTRLRATNLSASPGLRALQLTPDATESPLHIWATTPDNPLCGGLVGHTWASWLHVTFLWVDPDLRGTGLGTDLLARAERIARDDRACTAVRLETWDFQAPGFYRKQGYEEVCAIPDYPPGVTEFTFTKRLA
ncbi:N-acetyltransferase [Streptomyces niveiscabiei]|uniref:GNAT family N-acetyltransferase n=1 Tax=Streptomyces niveiscabiei TaxID=164115 RepID=UPI0029AEB59E|nr:N-acetyltransferase [Streptomyces niveiscabiei]MDX3387723.1 N-acetyltransferase [Streptomyces niveiscabiei]